MSRIIIILTTSILVAISAQAANFEAPKQTVSAASILEPGMLKGELYTVTDPVIIDGYMNHYTVDSEFGPFEVTGDRALKKLIREIVAISELKKMTSLSTGTGAAVDAVVDTGKSVAQMATHPVESAKGMTAGVSRFFKRTTRTAKNVGSEVSDSVSDSFSDDEENDEEQLADDKSDADSDSKKEDDPGLTTQLTSSVLGIGKAHRELAKELGVDPYSDNAVLQEELNRVANISGSVGTITNFLIPIPTVVGTAADISDLVWNLSPTDLLIQNEEKLRELGYTDEQSLAFFSNKVYSPTEQTAFVGAVASLDNAKGREVLLRIASAAETRTEGRVTVRAALFAQYYHENVEPIAELMALPDRMVPAALTASGDGLIIAPLDQMLWTEEIEAAMERMTKLVNDHGANDEHLLWVEGRISDLALSQIIAAGWVESPENFDKPQLAPTD